MVNISSLSIIWHGVRIVDRMYVDISISSLSIWHGVRIVDRMLG